jgi:hypothetical protein
MEFSDVDLATVELTATGDIDVSLLLTVFADEGLEIDGVWGEMQKSIGVEPVVAHYIVSLLLQAENNAVAAVEGAGAMLLLQRVGKAVKRMKERRPEAAAEITVRRDVDGSPKRLFNYVLPEDPDELRLALDALPDDIAKSTPPVEKWWRHDHGWITAEEGWRLDGYAK